MTSVSLVIKWCDFEKNMWLLYFTQNLNCEAVVVKEEIRKRSTAVRNSALLLGIKDVEKVHHLSTCLLYTSPSPRDCIVSRMPSSA